MSTPGGGNNEGGGGGLPPRSASGSGSGGQLPPRSASGSSSRAPRRGEEGSRTAARRPGGSGVTGGLSSFGAPRRTASGDGLGSNKRRELRKGSTGAGGVKRTTPNRARSFNRSAVASGSGHGETSPVRARRTPGRSISMNNSFSASRSGAGSRRMQQHMSSLLDDSLEDSDSNLFGTGNNNNQNRFARSAVASRSNTTATTMASDIGLPEAKDPMSDSSHNSILPGESNSNRAGASSHGTTTWSRTGATSANSTRNMHNSTVALRFLEDPNDMDEFDLDHMPAPATQQTTAQSRLDASANFNMSSLHFPTVTAPSSNNNESIFDDEPTAPRYLASFGRTNTNGSQGGNGGNVFANRQDLREVDQSVNLMDVDAGKYESRRSRRNRGRGSGNNMNRRGSLMQAQAMVEVFLGGDAAGGPKDSPFNPKSKKFRNFYGDDDYPTCWERFTGCISLVFKILCSLPVLILTAVLVSGLFLGPMVVETMEQMDAQPKPAPSPATKAPTEAPAPVPVPEPAPVPVPSPSETNEREDATASASLLFGTDQVETRTIFLQGMLEQADFNAKEANLEALNWMAAYDPAVTPMNASPEVLERFAVAALYFALHPEATADAVNLEEDQQEGRRILANNEAVWMGPASVCDWKGIDCNDSGRVVHLKASKSSLQGSLPEELTLLAELIELDLSHNLIHGTIPESYPTKLSNLEYVWLQANQIGGSMPDSMGEWTSVYHLDLSENKLTGSLPTTLGHLQETRHLYLHQNQFAGSIPLELGHLPHVEYLYLGSNALTGELPMDLLSKLSSLVDLRLSRNLLTGTIPPEIETLHRLEFLYVANNNLRGELPDVFDRLHQLVEMDLHKNSLSGPLPASMGATSTLERLLLNNNKLTGTIPDTWKGITSLERLSLHTNSLSGSVPICAAFPLPTSIAADCTSAMECTCCEECH